MAESRLMFPENPPAITSVVDLYSNLERHLVFVRPAGADSHNLGNSREVDDDEAAIVKRIANNGDDKALLQELWRFRNAAQGDFVLVGREIGKLEAMYPAYQINIGGRYYEMPDGELSRRMDPLIEKLDAMVRAHH